VELEVVGELAHVVLERHRVEDFHLGGRLQRGELLETDVAVVAVLRADTDPIEYRVNGLIGGIVQRVGRDLVAQHDAVSLDEGPLQVGPDLARDVPQRPGVAAPHGVHAGIVGEAVALEGRGFAPGERVALQDRDVEPLLREQSGAAGTSDPAPDDHHFAIAGRHPRSPFS